VTGDDVVIILYLSLSNNYIHNTLYIFVLFNHIIKKGCVTVLFRLTRINILNCAIRMCLIV
jgi:hypothetical protein